MILSSTKILGAEQSLSIKQRLSQPCYPLQIALLTDERIQAWQAAAMAGLKVQ